MEQFLSHLLSSVKGAWKYRWWSLGVMWLVALIGWGRIYAMPDDYQSSARVFVDTQSILKPLLANMTSVSNVEQQVAIMSRTLLSRPNIERVMRMVDLDVRAATPRMRERTIEELMNTIKISGTGTFDIYTITYNHRNPRLARDVVQALLTIFVEGSFKGKIGDTQKAIDFIDEQIKSVEQRLVVAENLLKDFKQRNSELLPRQGSDVGAQLANAADALATARLQLAEAEQSRKALREQISGEAALPELRAATAVSPELDVRIADVNKNLDSLRLQYTEQHPDIVAARRLLAQLEERKAEEARQRAAAPDACRSQSPMMQQLKVVLAETEAKTAAAKVRVDEYAARYRRLQAQSQAAPEVETQLAQLNRDYLINKDNYEKLVARREAAKLSGELSASTEMMTFKIIDPPSLPPLPNGPNRLQLNSMVLLGALLAGLVTAWALCQARPTFVGPAMLREFTGLNVLGAVQMVRTPAETQRRRRLNYVLGAAFCVLLCAYAGVVATSLLKH